ncbi:MAG: hypothetical protein V7739_04200 [Motiliproteus sp.]
MATVDILDFLRPGFDIFSNSRDKEYLKLAIRNIAVAPKWWSEYGKEIQDKKIEFDWVKVKYTELDKHLKSDKNLGNGIGVYLFAVESEFKIIGAPIYVFYVGIAGEGESGRPIRERLREYIRISGIDKREKVHTALEYYHNETNIYYSVLDIESSDLSDLEKTLHGFYYPWANERDFPVKIKSSRRSW